MLSSRHDHTAGAERGANLVSLLIKRGNPDVEDSLDRWDQVAFFAGRQQNLRDADPGDVLVYAAVRGHRVTAGETLHRPECGDRAAVQEERPFVPMLRRSRIEHESLRRVAYAG